jgi:hypothetical protein
MKYALSALFVTLYAINLVASESNTVDVLQKFKDLRSQYCTEYFRHQHSHWSLGCHSEVSSKADKTVSGCLLVLSGASLAVAAVEQYALVNNNIVPSWPPLAFSWLAGAIGSLGISRAVTNYGVRFYFSSDDRLEAESVFAACKDFGKEELKNLSSRMWELKDKKAQDIIGQIENARD